MMARHAHVLSCLAKGMIKESLRATPQSNPCMDCGYLIRWGISPPFQLSFLNSIPVQNPTSTKRNTIISSIPKMAQVIARDLVVQSKIFLDSLPTAAPAPPSTTHHGTPEIAFLPTSLNAPFSTIRPPPSVSSSTTCEATLISPQA